MYISIDLSVYAGKMQFVTLVTVCVCMSTLSSECTHADMCGLVAVGVYTDGHVDFFVLFRENQASLVLY